jgi:hypothetical protein
MPTDWDYEQFWSPYRFFFLERGYTLYGIDTTDEDFTMCIPPSPRQQGDNVSHPYACFHVNTTERQCVDMPAVSRLLISHHTGVYFISETCYFCAGCVEARCRHKDN